MTSGVLVRWAGWGRRKATGAPSSASVAPVSNAAPPIHDPSHRPPPSRRRVLPRLSIATETHFSAPEVYGSKAIANIARALPFVERAYASVRFSILRPKL